MMESAAAHMLRNFHHRLGLPAADFPTDGVGIDQAWFRQRLLQSEVDELEDAVVKNDLVKIADGLADVVYAAYGTALTYGIDLDAVLSVVHRSNMTKSPPETPGGKAVKGPDYEPPDLEAEIGRQLAHGREIT